MKPTYLRPAGGALLILAGIVLLLQNVALLPPNAGWLWALLFFLAALLFFAVFATDRTQWWALFPALPLLGLTVVTGGASLFPGLPGVVWGALFMAMISLAFWLVFFARPSSNWWAAIPGGVLVTIAVMIGLSGIFPGLEQGGVMFLGIGLTFLVLYLIPMANGGQKWAIFPAIPLIVLGLLFLLTFTSLWSYFWPLALVIAGGWMLWRAFRPGSKNTTVTRL